MQNINVSGIYRSGTTVVYGIVRKIIETISSPLTETGDGCINESYKIRKTHQDAVFNGNAPIPSEKTTYSYRDLRDVVASFCTKLNMNFNNFNVHGQSVVPFIEHMIRYDKIIMERNNILVLQYEKDILDIEGLISKIVDFLNVEITIDGAFINSFRIKNVKEQIKNIKTQFDRKTLLWYNHVSDGKVGKWQNYFTKEEIAVFNDNSMLCEWNKKRGY